MVTIRYVLNKVQFRIFIISNTLQVNIFYQALASQCIRVFKMNDSYKRFYIIAYGTDGTFLCQSNRLSYLFC